jgi:hypothetical protein
MLNWRNANATWNVWNTIHKYHFKGNRVARGLQRSYKKKILTAILEMYLDLDTNSSIVSLSDTESEIIWLRYLAKKKPISRKYAG